MHVPVTLTLLAVAMVSSSTVSFINKASGLTYMWTNIFKELVIFLWLLSFVRFNQFRNNMWSYGISGFEFQNRGLIDLGLHLC